eukprot:13126684-Ditylum_brightwellii.AAC.1
MGEHELLAIHLPDLYETEKWTKANKSSILSTLRSILCCSREKSKAGPELSVLKEPSRQPREQPSGQQ